MARENDDAPKAAQAQNAPGETTVHDFDLRKVTWGYRDLFRRKIEELFAENLLGELNREVTPLFFKMLNQADSTCFDHVLKCFLNSLTPENKWIMTMPALFEDWCGLGCELAREHLYMGERYFYAWRRNALGKTPELVAEALVVMRRLKEIDPELAYQFLKGCETLYDRLDRDEVRAFVDEALNVFRRNRRTGLRFMALELKSSKVHLRELTREARLEEIKGRLERFFRGIAGRRVEIDNLGALDSDELLERGTMHVCMYQWLYLPARIRQFESRRENRGFYLLMTAVSAACHACDSLPRVQGAEGYSTALQAVEGERIPWPRESSTVFQLVELRRVLDYARARFPGLRRLVDFGIEAEMRWRPARSAMEELLYGVLTGEAPRPALEGALRLIEAAAAHAESLFDTLLVLPELTPKVAEALGEPLDERFRVSAGWSRHPVLAAAFRLPAFFPDFMYPARVAEPPPGNLAADLRDRAQGRRREEDHDPTESQGLPDDHEKAMGESENGEDDSQSAATSGEGGEKGDAAPGDAVKVGYFYDEWNGLEHEYYEKWCCVREVFPKPSAQAVALGGDVVERARRVQGIFERLKPDETHRIKRLPDGDEIDIDRALEYIAERRARISPKARFYSKPYTARRSLATAVLIDLSGSTNEPAGDGKIIDREKEAAFILAEGLSRLGDLFGIFGFTGTGRERCEYHVFKDFEDDWAEATRRRLFAAHPGSSTRIGAALRHCGWKLRHAPARRRLVVLITDGKPMDTGYEPSNRYAQYDVRMACEENARHEINTFCISTLANTRADLELMFPRKRYLIIEDMQELPELLSRFYLRLTR